MRKPYAATPRPTCFNPDHVWTTVHGFGTKQLYEICLRDLKVKKGIKT